MHELCQALPKYGGLFRCSRKLVLPCSLLNSRVLHQVHTEAGKFPVPEPNAAREQRYIEVEAYTLNHRMKRKNIFGFGFGFGFDSLMCNASSLSHYLSSVS